MSAPENTPAPHPFVVGLQIVATIASWAAGLILVIAVWERFQ